MFDGKKYSVSWKVNQMYKHNTINRVGNLISIILILIFNYFIRSSRTKRYFNVHKFTTRYVNFHE